MNEKNQKYDLILVDVDGTLTKERSSWMATHRYFNAAEQAHKNYMLFKEGKIDYKGWMELDIDLWPKGFTRQTIIDSFDYNSIDPKALEIIQKLKNEGYNVTAMSIGPAPIIQTIAERFEIKVKVPLWLFDEQGIYTGIDQTAFFKDKEIGFKTLMKELNIDPKRVISIGDTMFDKPTFDMTEASIAINCHDDLVKYASHIVNSWEEIPEIIIKL